MSENGDGGVERIAPGGEAGLRTADVMNQAEVGDTIYVEFSLEHESGIVGEYAEVTTVNDWMLEDGRTRGVSVHMETRESARFGHVTFRLLDDTESAHVSFRSKIEYKHISGGARTEAPLEHVNTVEIEREKGVSADV